MNNLVKVLTGLAALAFIMAVVTAFTGPIMGYQPRPFSHACTNLALLAIAVSVIANGRSTQA